MLVHELVFQGETDKIAFHGENSVTYGTFQEKVEGYRAYLYAQGVREGDNVGLFSRNSKEFVYSYMAIVGLGGVVVPINFQLSAREIAYIVKDAEIKTVVTMHTLDLAEALDQQGVDWGVNQLVLADIETAIATGDYAAVPACDTIDDSHDCAIIYTSGTTGNPKGAVLTHKNLIANSYDLTAVVFTTGADNALCVLPMYHAFGWLCAVINPLHCGGAVTILDTFAPKETMQAIAKYQVTMVYGVPAMFNILARSGDPELLKTVRTYVSGGASLPETVAKLFAQRFGVKIQEGYGLSEASPVVTMNPHDRIKIGSIGVALPSVDLKIEATEGEYSGHGVGELLVKGPNVMRGYYHLPEATEFALRDGWLHTGDVAYCDEEGYFFIVDRLKDMIITSGENVYPREIEELIYGYEGVLEAAVIGVDDKLRGQSVKAFIVVEAEKTVDVKALKQYLTRNLALYKVPREIVVLDALPKNQTGKIMKRMLS
ncbi:MAG: AMP-binding protein [Selenomonadales bacterium]|nr:AMP-binding protein [Selenomonadales bacterium]